MQIALEQTARGRIELDYCGRCRGIWFDAQELAALLNLGNLDAFTARSPLWLSDEHSELSCPRHGHSPMRERELLSAQHPEAPPLHIDQCVGCEGVWLDGPELQRVVSAVQVEAAQDFLTHGERPTGLGLWLFMFFTGLPIEGFHPRRRRPIAVTALFALCVLAFLGQAALGLPESVDRYGLVPAALRSAPLPLLSHMFLHGGLGHLLGNLYFLWVFGDNVEDRLGRGRFALLYLTAGLGAALLHCALTDDPGVPVVGASGAISGVMAAYAVLFPRARLISLILFWQVHWRATTYLGMWLVFQVIGAALHTPGIAWWAHIGGFVAGGALAAVFRSAVRRSRGAAGR